MTLQSTRPITLADVRAEFGGSVGTTLGSYVRGGAYVPNTSANAGVPTSKPITLGNLLGASAASAPLTASATAINGSGQTADNPHPPPTYFAYPALTTVGTSTCTASGGTGSYTYSWSISGSGMTIYGSTTSATVTVRNGTAKFAGVYNATLTCVVNDGSTTKTVTAAVKLTVTNP